MDKVKERIIWKDTKVWKNTVNGISVIKIWLCFLFILYHSSFFFFVFNLNDLLFFISSSTIFYFSIQLNIAFPQKEYCSLTGKYSMCEIYMYIYIQVDVDLQAFI